MPSGWLCVETLGTVVSLVQSPQSSRCVQGGDRPRAWQLSQLNVSIPEAQASAFLARRSQELSDMLAASCVMQAGAGLRPPHAGAGPASLASPAPGVGGHAQPWSILLAWLSWLLSLAAPQPGGEPSGTCGVLPKPWGQGHRAPESRGPARVSPRSSLSTGPRVPSPACKATSS